MKIMYLIITDNIGRGIGKKNQQIQECIIKLWTSGTRFCREIRNVVTPALRNSGVPSEDQGNWIDTSQFISF